mmetsp:Transcript_64741/g.75277  ORF Transcript_64741/g.75277 Transcript_64741/m.75277 type:complete len:284 (+) Transcript_64741:420-1271(+)
MNFKNFKARAFVWKRNFDLSVQTTWSHECRIECIWSIGGHDDFDFTKIVETVHLVQKLHQCSLNFSVSTASFRKSSASDSIDFVHENNARLMLLCIGKHFSNDSGTLSDILINDTRSDNFQETGLDVAGKGSGNKGFSGSRRTIHQDSFWWLDTDSQEELRVCQWQFNSFSKSSDLVIQTTDLTEGNLSWIFIGHIEDCRIDFSWKDSHDSQSCHIQSNSGACCEFVTIELLFHSDNVARAAGSFDDEFLVIDFLEDFTDDLADRLQAFQIVFGFIEIFVEFS